MNQDKIWDAYQNDPMFLHTGCPNKGRHKYLAGHIATHAVVLNIGIGDGNLERVLHARNIKVYSLDPSEESVERMHQELGVEGRAKVGYSQEIPYSEHHFDCVIMTEVLEHLPSDILSRTLVEVLRVLKPSGTFLGTVPADERLETSLVVCPSCEHRFHRWGHLQSFSFDRLARLLETSFSETNVRRIAFDDLAELNWKGKIVYGLRALQARLGFRAGNQHFFFEAKLPRHH